MKRWLLFVLIFLSFSGCTTVTGNKTFLARYEGIQRGVTTKAEVVRMLGKPGEVLRPQASGEVMIYEQRKHRSSPGFFTTHCYLDTERLSVYMTEQDVVRDYVRDSLSEQIQCQAVATTYSAPRNSSTNVQTNYLTTTPLAPRTSSYH
jgi:hypothetical protein